LSIDKLFIKAEAFVRENYPEDLEWSKHQVSVEPLEEIDKAIFLREYAYVVYCSGFKQSTVEKHWPDLYKTYHEFNPALISQSKEQTRERALKYIGNKRKVESVLNTAEQLKDMTWGNWINYKQQIKDSVPGFDILEELPFIGPKTKFHLARNMGFNVAKPDRHLERIAAAYKMTTASMCKYLSEKSEELTGIHYDVHTIDSIFWRAASEGETSWDSESETSWEEQKRN